MPSVTLTACEKELKTLRIQFSDLKAENTKLEKLLERANKPWKHPERLGSSEEREGSEGGSKRSSKRNTRKRKSQNKSRNKNH